MKITAIEAIHLRIEDPNIGLFDGSYDDCVIVIHTDDGVTGLGETESIRRLSTRWSTARRRTTTRKP